MNNDNQPEVFNGGPNAMEALALKIKEIKERLALRAKVPIAAIAFEVALVSVETTERFQYWVMDCPVCSNERRLALLAGDTF